MSKKRSIVTNTGSAEYVEVYNDKEYRIPAHGEIQLPRSEAIDFVGHYVGGSKSKPLTIRHLPFESNEDGKFVCNLCGKDFGTQRGLEIHLAKEHGEEDSAEDTAKKKAKLYICPLCKDFKTTKRAEIVAHIRTHAGNHSIEELLDAIEKVG